MEKGIYIPTGENVVVLKKINGYAEILLNGKFIMVSEKEIVMNVEEKEIVSLSMLKENIFFQLIKHPINDLLYSYNTNRLIPENHQFKPLIKFLNSNNNRILIADEVGLGKTIEAGLIYKEIEAREELNVSIIVVPSSLTYKWKEEFEIRFNEFFEIKKTNQFLQFIEDYDSFHSSKTFSEKIIISYQTLRNEKVVEKLNTSFLQVDFLIMDEVHFMRNNDTSTYFSGKAITETARNIVFLSATPVQNKIMDLFNILNLLDPDYFSDYDFFVKMIQPNTEIHKLTSMLRNNVNYSEIKLYIESQNKQNSELNSVKNQLINAQEINKTERIEYIKKLENKDFLSYIINRTKKRDIGRLIPRVAKSIIVKRTIQEKKYYDSVIDFVKFIHPSMPSGFITIMPERMASSSMIASLENFKEIRKTGKIYLQDYDENDEKDSFLELNKEAQLLLDVMIENGNKIGKEDSKFSKFIDLISELKQQGIKQIIVFSFFRKTIDYLNEKLKNADYEVAKIHGEFKSEERFQIIKEFRNGKFDILLSSEVGSEGLDMQFCNVIFNYDLPWNPMRVEQRIGRIDRIGQKFEKLFIFNLCIEESIEDRIYNRLYEKLNIFENSIGELEPILGNLNNELNIAELIDLNQDEIDNLLSLKELAIKRQEIEQKEQTIELEKLINDSFEEQNLKEDFFENIKIDFVQKHCKKIFINYLNNNEIKFRENKNKELVISEANLKRLVLLLKSTLSDKRSEAGKYKLQRDFLQSIYHLQSATFNFETNYNEEYHTIYLFLNHPIFEMLKNDRKQEVNYAVAKHSKIKNAIACIYRSELKHSKNLNFLKIILHDKDTNKKIDEEFNYFEFMSELEEINNSSNADSFTIDEKIINESIIHDIERIKTQEEYINNRNIDLKINSICFHYEKQISNIKNVIGKLKDTDIIRMRTFEIENLKEKLKSKVEELEKKKNTQHNFEVLGYVNIN